MNIVVTCDSSVTVAVTARVITSLCLYIMCVIITGLFLTGGETDLQLMQYNDAF